jgi:3-oxoacyl-(acyl-carrier-protein) synthase
MELSALPLRIAGLGAVSPAGWGTAALVEAVRTGSPLPQEEITRLAGAPVQHLRRVPRPAAPPAYAREPRLRRTSPITGYAVAAALEALGPQRSAMVKAGALRVGVIMCMLNGCVAFSRRFFAEVLENPATASPLIFPETVFNAPSSHLATLLGTNEVNYTLVGDTAQFPAALDLAALWLETGEVDGVLAVAAEEADWLSGEAAAIFDRGVAVAEGAGALYLEPAATPTVFLQRPVALGPGHPRRSAAGTVRGGWRTELGPLESGTLLCDGLVGARRADAAEAAAFADWTGPRVSPGRVLGDGLGARAVWQCVIAAAAVAEGSVDRSLVSAIGTNQQALGVLFGS